MPGQTACMSKSKKPTGTPQPRKPYKVARIKWVVAEAADRRAEELAQDFTQYVTDSVRMRLEAEGFWPPKPAR